MKTTFPIVLLFIFFWTNAQQQILNHYSGKGVNPHSNSQQLSYKNTFAVVVGISDYQDPDIPDLQYAKNDAIAFVNYLKSSSGGLIPDDHIVYLLDEKATAGQYAASFDWLIHTLKKGDRAIIYFSGHADVERKISSQPAFLLCWDSPSKVYTGGGAFGLAYLNDVSFLLTSQTQARVDIIMDLWELEKPGIEDTVSNQNLTDYFIEQFNNEIRIISCHSNGISHQGRRSIKGRSEFSYHLLNGLTGLADVDHNKLISFFEISNYLHTECDKINSTKFWLQITVGEPNSIVSKIDLNNHNKLINDEFADLFSGDLLTNDSIKRTMYSHYPRDPVLLEKYINFNKALDKGQLLIPEENSAWSIYQELKGKNIATSDLIMMQNNLVAAFQDEAQQAINDYLNSDPAELKKRWSYDDRYEKFPVYLGKAAEILGDKHLLYKTIKSREHYFAGLNLRLHGERTNDTALHRLAMIEQNVTITLDSSAAYAYNELGILQRRFKDYERSIPFFKQAITLSPRWAYPWANLCSSYDKTGNSEMAIQSGLKAVELNPKSILSQYNLGNAYQHNSNWKAAAVHYSKTLELDSTDKDALLNLAQVLYEDKNYLQAEYYVLKCMKIYPDYPRVYLPLTFIYIQKGQNDKALEALEKTFQNGFKQLEELEQEPDFKSLMKDPGYTTLKKKYFN